MVYRYLARCVRTGRGFRFLSSAQQAVGSEIVYRHDNGEARVRIESVQEFEISRHLSVVRQIVVEGQEIFRGEMALSAS